VKDMRAKEILREKVVALDGEFIGEVEDLELSDEWRVEWLIVSLERSVAKKMGSKFGFRAKGRIPVDIVKGTKNYVTLSLEGDELYSKIEKL